MALTNQTRTLPRDQIAQFIPTPRGVKAFEALQQDSSSQYTVLTTGTFLTLNSEPQLGAERLLTLTSGDLVGVDSGANAPYTISLAPTAVTAGGYGSASQTLALAIDAKGRITSATAYSLNTANVTEGSNLYYTDARARAALSGTSGVTYTAATGAIKATSAGTYGAPTGTLSRAALASYVAGTGLTYSAAYVQAEQTAGATRIAAIEAALATLSQTVAALITDMRANGNLA